MYVVKVKVGEISYYIKRDSNLSLEPSLFDRTTAFKIADGCKHVWPTEVLQVQYVSVPYTVKGDYVISPDGKRKACFLDKEQAKKAMEDLNNNGSITQYLWSPV